MPLATRKSTRKSTHKVASQSGVDQDVANSIQEEPKGSARKNRSALHRHGSTARRQRKTDTQTEELQQQRQGYLDRLHLAADKDNLVVAAESMLPFCAERENQQIEDVNELQKQENSVEEGEFNFPLRQELQELHEEMEIAAYAIIETGQRKKILPRRQMREHTKKRRRLEHQDTAWLAKLTGNITDTQCNNLFQSEDDLNEDDNESDEGCGDQEDIDNPQDEAHFVSTHGRRRRRLRGAYLSTENHVVEGSRVLRTSTMKMRRQSSQTLAPASSSVKPDNAQDPSMNTLDDSHDNHEGDRRFEEGEDDRGHDNNNDSDDDNDGVRDDDVDQLNPSEMDESLQGDKTEKKGKKRSFGGMGRPRRRKRPFRIRNFKSYRMAQRHGDALGAHARGMPRLAIQKLKQVAHDAPSAPQIYASLGMVYEDMLRESRRSEGKSPTATVTVGKLPLDANQPEDMQKEGEVDGTLNSPKEIVPDRMLAEQLDIAKKAYGSFHVACLLAKRDYSLWVRAADSAKEVADLHKAIMSLPVSEPVKSHHQAERTRWLAEARNDYKAADHLKPPGIDVPAKLADVYMELGCFSEALTLLTDLKNNSQMSENERTEFESSYKAWLLYSDLMLHIGRECELWNQGIRVNKNNMFRRWLRKLSTTYDWKERRLQALAKALEAAAGTKSCTRLIKWLIHRAYLVEKTDTGVSGGVRGSTTDTIEKLEGMSHTPAQLAVDNQVQHLATVYPNQKHFKVERELLVKSNQSELDDFDKTTSEMNLAPNSVELMERERSRKAMIFRHKKALVELAMEFQGKKDGAKVMAIHYHHKVPVEEDLLPPLPLSASCRTVFRIADQLFRHMIDMGLYKGGELLGEAVSLYMKERAAMLEGRFESDKKYKLSQSQPTSIFALHHEHYDGIGDLSEGYESEVVLSDDESDLAFSHLETLRRGLLPVDLMVYYGISLAGEGGSDYLAVKCLRSIELLPRDEEPWLEGGIQAEEIPMSHDIFMIPLTQITATNLLVLVLRRTGRFTLLADRLSPLFDRLTTSNIQAETVRLLSLHQSSNVPTITKNQIKEFLLSMSSFQIELLSSCGAVDSGTERSKKTCHLLEMLSGMLPELWKLDASGAVSEDGTRVVSMLAKASLWVSTDLCGSDLGHSFLKGAFDAILSSVSFLCGTPDLNMAAIQPPMLSEVESIPYPSTLLSTQLESIAMRSFELCVATNVALFSGWNSQVFQGSTSCLGPNFSAVSVVEGHVRGCLDESFETQILDQWQLLRDILPKSAFMFADEFAKVKASVWYKETKCIYEEAAQISSIARNGEEDGLNLFLSFSRIALVLAQLEADSQTKMQFLAIAFAILLPVSQFCLNKTIWLTKIGEEVSSRNPPASWRPLRKITNCGKPVASRRRAVVRDSVDKALLEWFDEEQEDSPWTNLLPIPLSMLKSEWNNFSSDDDGRYFNDRGQAHEIMATLHISMQKLRSCHSQQAVEKASLRVASSLLDLVGCSQSLNPFLCLQQAALFASQAAKGGSSDISFKSPLPAPHDCTPTQALVILGRAECLQAVYFFQEAAFLCSYVVSICKLHRDRAIAEHEWNVRWWIIGILAYNTTVMIRCTANSIHLDHHSNQDWTGTWELSVIEELKRARDEGTSWIAEVGLDNVNSRLIGRMDHSKHRKEGCSDLGASVENKVMEDFQLDQSEYSEYGSVLPIHGDVHPV